MTSISTCSARAATTACTNGSARTSSTAGSSFAVWAPSREPSASTGDFCHWGPGRRAPAAAWIVGRVGGRRPRRGRGAAVQVPRHCGLGRAAREGRSARLRGRGATVHRVGDPPVAARVEATTEWIAPARPERRARPAHVGLRGPPRLVAPQLVGGRPRAHLPGARRRAVRVLHRHGLHPRRAAARHGPPVRRLVGLPGHVVLRPVAAAGAHPTTSRSSSTACTRTGSA